LLLYLGIPRKRMEMPPVEPQSIYSRESADAARNPGISPRRQVGERNFNTFLAESAQSAESPIPDRAVAPPPVQSPLPADPCPATFSPSCPTRGAAAYKAQEDHSDVAKATSGIEKYKDDQLLLHPGGDHYYLERKEIIQNPEEQNSFWGRIGKDLSDAWGNVTNFFQDAFFGAKVHFRDEKGNIQESTRPGLVGSVVDFFKDFGSAFTFGAWRPDGEEAPQGILKRAGFFLSKLKEAFLGDLLQGVAGSAIHMGKDLLFAGWNTAEVIPDATIGNFDAGRKLTTAVFDNGQVVLDYLTDIVPMGDAWVRVHSMDVTDLTLPVIENLQKEERSSSDLRWKTVRNTPFRKSIETVGSLLMDLLAAKVLGHVKIFSGEKRR
jgi:hypothetical protein